MVDGELLTVSVVGGVCAGCVVHEGDGGVGWVDDRHIERQIHRCVVAVEPRRHVIAHRHLLAMQGENTPTLHQTKRGPQRLYPAVVAAESVKAVEAGAGASEDGWAVEKVGVKLRD